MRLTRPSSPGRSGSQTRDQRIALARRFIEQRIAEGALLRYRDVRTHLETLHAVEPDHALEAALRAELELERENAMHYQYEPFGMRDKRDGDVLATPLDQVADQIIALGWEHGRTRKVVDVFHELDGRYRHCDLYDALHTVLKGKLLKSLRSGFQLMPEVDRIEARLADPTTPLAERLVLELQVREARQQALVDEYVASRPAARLVPQWKVDGLFADLYDAEGRVVIEAKADSSPTTVAHALGQVNLYRNLANTDTARPVARVAILLPEPLCDRARKHLTLEGGVEVITRAADGTFESERFV